MIRGVLMTPTNGGRSKDFMQKLKHCRGACRSWAKHLVPIDQRAHDTHILINAIDLLEEHRVLHPDERNLRCLATQGLHDIHAEKLARLRQRFHTRVAVEWDENSRFFHAAVSGRRWRNNIVVLEGDGIVATTHSAKHTILHNFYLDLLGLGMATGIYPSGSGHPYPYPLGLNFTRRVTRTRIRVRK